jgi:hypothetical protein
MVDVAEIERRVDRTIAGAVVVSHDIGGVKFTSMIEVMEFAKLMAVSGAAVPAHLRGNPGACLGIVVQALEWRMSPFAVANKSYIANDRTAYESQLIHAIVEARAPLKGRLRFEILGEGDERRCKVSGTFVREDKPHTYTSETLAKLRDARGRNDRGQVKGSPLWDTQPEVQLFYSASRTWARLYCPDVILGIYAVDELPAEPIDVTPSKTEALAKRLEEMKAQHAERRGFDAEHVSREATKSSVIEGEANPGNAEKGEKDERGNESDVEGRQDRSDDRGDGDRDQGGSQADGSDGGEVVGEPAGFETESQEGQGESTSGGATGPKGKAKR